MSVEDPEPWTPMQGLVDLATLGKCLEELGEATAIIARCVIQGIDEYEPVTKLSNRHALTDECADVLAAIAVITDRFKLDTLEMDARRRRKIKHLTRWHGKIAPLDITPESA